jgi:hypothetical protein
MQIVLLYHQALASHGNYAGYMWVLQYKHTHASNIIKRNKFSFAVFFIINLQGKKGYSFDNLFFVDYNDDLDFVYVVITLID